MGYGCGHMASPDKAYMGWLDACNVVDANISASFNLLPSEMPCNGTQALRLPTFDGRQYWLEYRKPVGFDTDEGTDGVLVHVSAPGDYWGPEAYTIDLGEGAFIHAGETYSDPDGTVTFIVAEEHDTHAVIDVVFPDGGSGAPQCLNGSTPMQVGGAYGTLDCAWGPFEPDGEPPEVAITTPHAGAVYAFGESFSVSVSAEDDSGVYSVSLLLDGAVADTKTQPPWDWEINDLPLGEHTLQATATDGVLEGLSAVIDVQIDADGSDGGGDGAGGGDGEGGDDDGGGTGGSGDGADGGDGADDGGDPDAGALPPGFGRNGLGEGCSCRSRDASGSAPTWLLIVIVGALRRRACSSVRAGKLRPRPRPRGC